MPGEDTMAERVPEALVVRPGEGRAIDLGGFQISVKADGAAIGGAFSLLEAAGQF